MDIPPIRTLKYAQKGKMRKKFHPKGPTATKNTTPKNKQKLHILEKLTRDQGKNAMICQLGQLGNYVR